MLDTLLFSCAGHPTITPPLPPPPRGHSGHENGPRRGRSAAGSTVGGERPGGVHAVGAYELRRRGAPGLTIPQCVASLQDGHGKHQTGPRPTGYEEEHGDTEPLVERKEECGCVARAIGNYLRCCVNRGRRSLHLRWHRRVSPSASCESQLRHRAHSRSLSGHSALSLARRRRRPDTVLCRWLAAVHTQCSVTSSPPATAASQTQCFVAGPPLPPHTEKIRARGWPTKGSFV